MAGNEWFFAHGNAIAASMVFVAVIASDCLSASNSATHADVREPAVHLVGVDGLFCRSCGAKLAREASALLQRPVVAALLVAAAALGEHRGGVLTRAFDAGFATLALLLVTLPSPRVASTSHQGNASSQQRRHHAVSTSSVMVAVGMMLYGNLRLLRSGLLHAIEVSNFTVPVDGTDNASGPAYTVGYAHASDMASASVSGGAGLGWCLGRRRRARARARRGTNPSRSKWEQSRFSRRLRQLAASSASESR